jgi:hypothetical protein
MVKEISAARMADGKPMRTPPDESCTTFDEIANRVREDAIDRMRDQSAFGDKAVWPIPLHMSALAQSGHSIDFPANA